MLVLVHLMKTSLHEPKDNNESFISLLHFDDNDNNNNEKGNRFLTRSLFSDLMKFPLTTVDNRHDKQKKASNSSSRMNSEKL